MKPIPGFADYFVDKKGHVWSAKRPGRSKKRYLLVRLKLKENHDGYLVARMSLNGKRKDLFAHVAVLLTYAGPAPKGYESRHLNNKRTDNRRSNLEWALRKVNIDDRRKFGTNHANEKHPRCKFSDEDIKAIRRRYKPGAVTMAQVAKKFGTNSGYVYRIIRNHNRKKPS